MTTASLDISFAVLPQRFAWVLVDASFKTALLLACVIVINFCLRRCSAAFRDRIWTLAFCGILAVPFVSIIVPQWPVPFVSFGRSLSQPQYPPLHDASTAQARNRSSPRDQRSDQGFVNSESFSIATAESRSSLDTSKSSGIDQNGESSAFKAGLDFLSSRAITNVVLLVWCSGMLVALSQFVIAYVIRWKQIGRNTTLSTPIVVQTLQELTNRVGLVRRIRLLQDNNKTIPMTAGIVHPVIILPSDWCSWPTERLRFVMLHELAHVKRLDVLFQSIARIACAIYWFNPLCWYALGRMRFDCELACDDRVISFGEASSAYATQLIAIARNYRPVRFAGGIAMARSSKLEGRVVALLDERRSHSLLSKVSGRMVATGSMLLILVLSGMTLGKAAAVESESNDSPKAVVNSPTPAAKPLDGPAIRDELPATDVAAAQGDEKRKLIAQVPATEPKQESKKARKRPDRVPRPNSGILGIAAKDDVLKELGIASDSAEYAKIQELAKKVQPEVSRLMNFPTEEERTKFGLVKSGLTIIAAVEAKLIPELKNLITADQFARLQQINWQHMGVDVLYDPEIIDRLKITDAQRQQFDVAADEISVQQEARKDRSEQEEKSGPIDGLQKRIDELRQRLADTESVREKCYAVLSADQREKLSEVLGKPFAIQEPNRGPLTAGPRMPVSTQPGGYMTMMLREPILKELGIATDAAVLDEIRKLADQQSVEMRKQMIAMNSPHGDKVREVEAKLRLQFDPEFKKLLTPDQFTRVRQIYWQRMGIGALQEAEVVEALQMTKEQQTQISDLIYDRFQKIRNVNNPAEGRRLGPVNEETRRKIEEITTETQSRSEQILTAEQRQKFAELKGKPFDLSSLQVNSRLGAAQRSNDK